ncbi:MAG: NifU family protein [Acidimicrobiales bacterium]|nr:NifU family protein [Acidimicrobiales bacterium]MCB9393536.1 NifU family protein [Acidimicrobiaceae bacterium]
MTVIDDRQDTFETRAARLDAARRAVDRLESDARIVADEYAAAVDAHVSAVLHHLVVLLRSDDRGRELLYEAVDDPEVFAALVKAGIVKPSLAMRAIQVLDGVRPYLTSHNGDVELVRIADGVAYVRLLGACQSCGSATETLRDSVAEALLEHLPEIREVRDVPPDAAPAAPQTTFIPLSSLTFGRTGR